jgi:hypothetical protein
VVGAPIAGARPTRVFATAAARHRGRAAVAGTARSSVGRQMSPDLVRAYRDHLTAGDLAVLAEVAAGPLPDALGSPALEHAVFGLTADPQRVISPFLIFAVAVHRTAATLAGAAYVNEWVGPRQRVPVFAVPALRALLDDPVRRYFLVELLASYTHVASGSTWTATPRGWRRRRFSELDPIALAGMLEAVPAPERAGVLRRLGDLALFLTGVFPDHTALTALGRPLARARLLASAAVPLDYVAADSGNAFELLELLGQRWYRLAAKVSVAPGTVRVLDDMAERFTDARRLLNVVTDTYLFPLRDQWFGRPAA